MNPTAQDLYAHLDDAEFLAMKTRSWNDDDIATARKVIPDLVVVVRSVLLQHEETWFETCRFCQQPWPCPTVRSIHRVIKDPEREFVRLVESRP
ncbi:hypothetical protein [Amycolatopsis anabasis]|uniref:hypothetical protein n=1 Tax=Amycolatopsis anabasis TaxID=1840409 RepID=UPI00131D62CE|nr:hypothetical protein [Amycolatopsis anabasis]